MAYILHRLTDGRDRIGQYRVHSVVTLLGSTHGQLHPFSAIHNVFGANDLTFVYQIRTPPHSTLSACNCRQLHGLQHRCRPVIDGRFRVAFCQWNGACLDVSIVLADGDIGFNFLRTIPIADRELTTFALIIETNATQFTPGFFSVIDGGVAKVAAFSANGA